MKKIRILALMLCLVMVFTTGCEFPSAKAEPKTFSKSGLSIELTDAFAEDEHISYTACYVSTDIAVFTLKEEFSLFGETDFTLDEYAELVLEGNQLDSELIHEDGLTYFTFNNTANGKDYTYFASVYKGADAFWLVQLACVAEDYESLKPTLLAYAKSVQV